MTTMRKEPFKEFYQIRDELNKLMVTPFAKMMQGYMEYPRVDVYEQDNEIILRADVPGVKKENLDIKVARNSISIRGKVEEVENELEENYLYRERSFGEFTRTVQINTHMEYDLAKANCNNGILEIRVPKKEIDVGKKIQID